MEDRNVYSELVSTHLPVLHVMSIGIISQDLMFEDQPMISFTALISMKDLLNQTSCWGINY